jgi:molybdopterin-guanine dinucleotide biosynthesis protein A
LPQTNDDIRCCGVILSGGLNTRMGGRNKAFLKVGGKFILDRIIETLAPFFKEILLVTRQPKLYHQSALKIVEDIYESRSSLTGIHAGLYYAEAEFAFVVPCDAPFLHPGVIKAILDEIEPDTDVVVPVSGQYYQPLCAVYSKRCLPYIERQLDVGNFKIFDFYEHINMKTISCSSFLAKDPELRTFLNINTPDALETSKKMTSAR